MDCLALVLQPIQGPDILLQTCVARPCPQLRLSLRHEVSAPCLKLNSGAYRALPLDSMHLDHG